MPRQKRTQRPLSPAERRLSTIIESLARSLEMEPRRVVRLMQIWLDDKAHRSRKPTLRRLSRAAG